MKNQGKEEHEVVNNFTRFKDMIMNVSSGIKADLSKMKTRLNTQKEDILNNPIERCVGCKGEEPKVIEEISTEPTNEPCCGGCADGQSCDGESHKDLELEGEILSEDYLMEETRNQPDNYEETKDLEIEGEILSDDYLNYNEEEIYPEYPEYAEGQYYDDEQYHDESQYELRELDINGDELPEIVSKPPVNYEGMESAYLNKTAKERSFF